MSYRSIGPNKLFLPPSHGKNFKDLGPLTPEQESWWKSYGQKLHAAQQKWAKDR